MAAKKAVTETGVVRLQRLQDDEIELTIVGLTSYIPHKWSEKAKRMMPGHPDKPQLTAKKGVRERDEEAEACVYRMPDGRPGIPATSLKAAMVGGCRFFDTVKMVGTKVSFHVIGEGPDQLVPFEGEAEVREDTPRNANGGADLRYRTYFHNWRATVRVRFVKSTIDADSITALLDAGGRGGIGDWRPSAPKSATGTYGTFRVEVEEDAA